MQIDNEVFEKRLPEAISWEDEAFRFCEFRGIDAEGLHIPSVFLDCIFDRCDLYLSLFNNATFVGVRFKDCNFRGCSFLGCRFVECVFENCRFTADNVGGECRFDDSRWYACTQHGTQGLGADLASA
jgi:Pentapeptide repeats (9 copies)